MYTLIAYKFRVYPDAKRQSEIEKRLLIAQRLYNLLLEKTISSHKDGNSRISITQLNKFLKDAINEDESFLQLYSQTRQDIFMRLQKAYQNFFRRMQEKKAGKKIKVGFPRFKTKDRYKSLTYPQDNGSFSIEIEGKVRMLRISRIGRMKMEMHRDIEGRIKTLTIKREGREYYAIFTVVREINPAEMKDTDPVGIDMGLNNFIALSDGIKVQKPKFFKRSERRIAHWQRVISRRQRGSKRSEEARSKLQEEWKSVTNQSNDFMHKLSTKLVNLGYTSFVVESLNICNMEKNHRLSQAIQSASWKRFIGFLSYKAGNAGMKLVILSKEQTKYTTQECSNCGNVKKGSEILGLGDRTYSCNVCGLSIDRDINAAKIILKRAREGHSRSNALGDQVNTTQQVLQTGSLNREHTLDAGIKSRGSLGL